MEPTFKTDGVTLYHGDCLDVLRQMPDASVDAVVTDPPYGLTFMGRKWDYDVPSVEIWAECLRVLKPGGHLLSFAGTRTQHRMAVNIEDAGFEIRDTIAWVYGTGFPKSQDVSKTIDKAAGADREVVGTKLGRPGVSKDGGNLVKESWRRMEGRPDRQPPNLDITAPATDAAKEWHGWGTALKPAFEPITVARKPLIGTVVQNVLAHGTGAINVDACRVPTDDNLNGGAYSVDRKPSASEWVKNGGTIHSSTGREYVQPAGRWPANLVHDGSEEVMDAFAAFGESKPKAARHGVKGGENPLFMSRGDGSGATRVGWCPEDSGGTAARFFYTAKASRSDRGEGNTHPTVKPTELMKWLVRLVCRKGGVVMDPFAGSGTTAKACLAEGMECILIEREAEYVEIIKNRLAPDPGSLFG